MNYDISKFHAKRSLIEWYIEHQGVPAADVLLRIKTHANVKFQGISGEWNILAVGKQYFMVTCQLDIKG